MRAEVLRIMRNHLTAVTLLGAVVLLGSAGVARAGSIAIVGGSVAPPNTWTIEPGQSMPSGTGGFVGGLLIATTAADTYTFTYGGGGLVAGDTGHGNSTFPNEFWVGPNELAAEGSGQVFCTQAGDASCGGVATAVGAQFTVVLGPGLIPFGFTYGPNHISVLLNGGVDPANGAYLAQIGAGNAPFAGGGLVGYLGLSDSAYPGDADFQDLVVRVSTTPEPATLLFMGVGLIGLAYARRRKNS